MKKTEFKLLFLLLTVCLVLCVSLAGCMSADDYEEMYNDDSKIAHGSSNVRIGSVETTIGNTYKLSCSSLSGVYIAINSFTVNESTSANLSFELNSGKCKIVLVKDGSVYKLAEESFDGEVNFKNIPDGKYRLKIVGVEAEFKITLKY